MIKLNLQIKKFWEKIENLFFNFLSCIIIYIDQICKNNQITFQKILVFFFFFYMKIKNNLQLEVFSTDNECNWKYNILRWNSMFVFFLVLAVKH